MSILLSLLQFINKQILFSYGLNKRLMLVSFFSINNLTQLFDDVILKWKVCDVVFSSLWQAFLIVRDDSITSPLRMKKAKASFVDTLFQYQENHPYCNQNVQRNKIISTLTFQILDFNNPVHLSDVRNFAARIW